MPCLEEIEAASAVLRDGRTHATSGPEPVFLTTDKVSRALEAAERVRAPRAFACPDGAAMRANHRDRALQAIAEHRCSTRYTDGFCGPRHGKCARSEGHCAREADLILQAIEARGVAVLWEHDPTLIVTIGRRSTAPACAAAPADGGNQ